MDSLNTIKQNLYKAEYNAEPVTYCKHCLSLKIMILDENVDYCDLCGSTDTDTIDIRSWEALYKEKYNKTF